MSNVSSCNYIINITNVNFVKVPLTIKEDKNNFLLTKNLNIRLHLRG